MKKTVISILCLALVATFVFASGFRTFNGDIGVNTRISQYGMSFCKSGESFNVNYNVTNYNMTNATATNVTVYYNITDDNILVYQNTKVKYLEVGETYNFGVSKCTIGNQTNHTIVSRINLIDPWDSYTGNNFDTATFVVN